jgi:hypothetical protein
VNFYRSFEPFGASLGFPSLPGTTQDTGVSKLFQAFKTPCDSPCLGPWVGLRGSKPSPPRYWPRSFPTSSSILLRLNNTTSLSILVISLAESTYQMGQKMSSSAPPQDGGEDRRIIWPPKLRMQTPLGYLRDGR